MQEIKIISEPSSERPFLVIYKPKGLPSAPLIEDDTDNALYKAAELYPEIKKVQGRKQIEYGLLHRIDTPTDGLLLIALSQEFYDSIQKQQSEGLFIKTYIAECEKAKPLNGFTPVDKKILETLEKQKKVIVSSYFRNYGEGKKSVRPVTETSGKASLKKIGKPVLYTTEITLKEEKKSSFLFECRIKSGYRHQVRCHLTWLGFPIIGDKLYNPNEDSNSDSAELKFTATKIEFLNPFNEEKEVFKLI